MKLYYLWTHPEDSLVSPIEPPKEYGIANTKSAELSANSADSITRKSIFFRRKEDKQLYQQMLAVSDETVTVPSWYKMLMSGQLDAAVFI